MTGSALLSVALFLSFIVYNSQLAFAQFADSFLDVVTAAVLAWTVALSAKPEDEDHQFGHKRAQPVGALVTAVLTGVLAVEVVQHAITALISGSEPEFDSLVLGVFGLKIVFKLMVYWRAQHLGRASEPAMKALAVDARNDVLASLVAGLGFLAARYEVPQLDAWLALPLALVIGWTGFDLAAENVRLLMGQAPSPERQRELVALVRGVAGVHAVGRFRAHYVGTELFSHVEVQVDASLTVGEAHDIGEAVRLCLETLPDVGRCSVHIDPAKAG